MVGTIRLQAEMNTIKDFVVGIFIQGEHYYLVMNHDNVNDTIDTLRITELGAIHQEYNTPTKHGELRMFPDGKNLNQMLEKPFEFKSFLI